jgi:hypothetical protein
MVKPPTLETACRTAKTQSHTTHTHSDYLPTERAALIAWWLSKGEQLTTRQVAERLGLTLVAAWYMLQRLSRVLPITYDDTVYNQGFWYSIQHFVV